MNNIYYLSGSELSKNKKLFFSDFSLGDIYNVDLFNPLKLKVWYKDYNTMVVLDNFLNEIVRVNFNNLKDPNEISHVSSSNENTMWVFDQLSMKIKKFDYIENSFVKGVEVLLTENIIDMNSNYNFLWVLTKNNFYMINYNGTIISESKNLGFNKVNFLKNNYTQRIIFFSFYQAFLSALISCLLAIPFALSLNRRKDLMIVKIIISLCGFAFVIPSILIVFSVIKIFGYNGFLNTYFDFYNIANIDSIYGLKGILIAHILLNTPFATRLFFQNLNNIPSKYYEISQSLNISVIGNILKLETPVIKQNLFAVFSIIFSLCFLSFAIVMALGGNPRNSTLEVAIYQYALFDLNFNKAIILSFIQMVICIFFVSISFSLVGKVIGFIIAEVIPAAIAIGKNALLIPCRFGSPNDILEAPQVVLTPSSFLNFLTNSKT